MSLVIADTGPINYLILIGHIDCLPALFERVILPEAVQIELAASGAPPEVRFWSASPPQWIEVCRTPAGFLDLETLEEIDDGEKSAIALAYNLKADLLLMDDRKGVKAAEGKGLRVTGTLGVLDLAAERGLVDFGEAIRKLKRTSFRRPAALLDALSEKHG